MAVTDFEPRLLELWRDAAFGGKIVEIPDTKEAPGLARAIRFRARMYELRKHMRREKHPDWQMAERVKISLEMQDHKSSEWLPYLNNAHTAKHYADKEFVRYRLNLQAADAGIDDILEGAGYDKVEAPDLD